MLYYILDLEFNQYFDFHDDDAEPEPACPSEIIQIGVVVMDEKLNVIERAGTMVKPQIFKRLHPHVQRITGLTMEELSEAPSFPEAYEAFFNFAFGRRAVFCTWGSEDVKELYRNILFYNLNHKTLTRRYLNVQKLYGVYRGKKQGGESTRQVGLKAAVEDEGFDTVKPFHNALSDAEYTADILKVLMTSKAVASSIQVQALNLSDLRQDISGRVNAVNVNLLYAHAERVMRRKLNDRDKEAVLEVYNYGRSGRFDVPGKHT